jgi:hypothetical protein
MFYNSSKTYYEYTRLFSTASIYNYNISCDGSSSGFTTLITTDYTSINEGTGPQGANITVLGSERANLSIEPESTIAEGGNVSAININAITITKSWQGYYGNISGQIVLQNAQESVFYNWDIVNPTGEVYATRAIDINFATMNCTDTAGIAAEEAFIGQTTDEGDSVNNTFNQQSHPEFSVGAITIPADTCRSTNIYVNSGPQSSNFYEVLISDAASNLAYTAIIDSNQVGFDGRPYDFQMLVGENGHFGDTQITPYYFFIEIS